MALALLAPSVTAAQQQPSASAPYTAQLRLGAVWAGTSGDVDVDGGHGSLETTLTSVDGRGVDASIEIVGSDLGLQLGATWLALDYEEDYRILSGSDYWYGHDDSSENAVNLYASVLVHAPLWGRHEVLLGPTVGVVSGGDQLVDGGLTFGAQAMMELRSGRDTMWYTLGARLTSVPLGGEYEDERFSLIQASLGVRFEWP
jgi:hypothetical protein